jgi:hypothetical protein
MGSETVRVEVAHWKSVIGNVLTNTAASCLFTSPEVVVTRFGGCILKAGPAKEQSKISRHVNAVFLHSLSLKNYVWLYI